MTHIGHLWDWVYYVFQEHTHAKYHTWKHNCGYCHCKNSHHNLLTFLIISNCYSLNTSAKLTLFVRINKSSPKKYKRKMYFLICVNHLFLGSEMTFWQRIPPIAFSLSGECEFSASCLIYSHTLAFILSIFGKTRVLLLVFALMLGKANSFAKKVANQLHCKKPQISLGMGIHKKSSTSPHGVLDFYI